jgi:hypothetical protein
MAENKKYRWLYRELKTSELTNHIVYKAVPEEQKRHPGGWSWLDNANYSHWHRAELKRREHREKRERLSRG